MNKNKGVQTQIYDSLKFNKINYGLSIGDINRSCKEKGKEKKQCSAHPL